MRSLFLVALLALWIAGCGGAGPRTTTSSASSPAPVTTSTTTSPAAPVRGRLVGQDHAPTVGRSWHYTVTVTDDAGHPLSGSVEILFVFAGQVVGHDTPTSHPVSNGRWQDALRFPAAAAGRPLNVRAVVHTSRGSITLDWPIVVRR